MNNEQKESMKINIEIDEQTIKQLILDYIQDKLGNIPIASADVSIMVKSKQNYKSTWEVADFKAEYKYDSYLTKKEY
jgi:hypothetical protein